MYSTYDLRCAIFIFSNLQGTKTFPKNKSLLLLSSTTMRFRDKRAKRIYDAIQKLYDPVTDMYQHVICHECGTRLEADNCYKAVVLVFPSQPTEKVYHCRSCSEQVMKHHTVCQIQSFHVTHPDYFRKHLSQILLDHQHESGRYVIWPCTRCRRCLFSDRARTSIDFLIQGRSKDMSLFCRACGEHKFKENTIRIECDMQLYSLQC